MVSTVETFPSDAEAANNTHYFAEALTEAPPLDEKSHEEFRYEADDFFREEKQLRQHYFDQRHPTPGDMARADLYRNRVQSPEFRELGELDDILFSAPIYSALHDFLDRAKEQFRQSDLGPIERRELITQVKEAKRGCVQYSHKLRDFLLENGDYIIEADMTHWLSKAMGGKERTAKTTVAGIGAEVAVARMIIDSGTRVEMSSVEQDLKGVDLIFYRSDGRRVLLDVKTGSNQSDGNYSGTNHELDIDSHMFQDFSVLPPFRASLLNSIDIS